MDEKKFQLAEKLRTYISCYGINDFSEERLKKAGLTSAELENNFSKREEIVELILTHERACFEKIFNEYNFDGWNAIDILLLVSNEINERFFDVLIHNQVRIPLAIPDIGIYQTMILLRKNLQTF